jgi:alpha,alpha-trehalose phosphorylase
MDLADLGGNVKDGAHIASIGGTWMAVVHGIAGFRDDGDLPAFRPMVPHRDIQVRLRLTLRSRLLEIRITPDRVTYEIIDGDALEIRHQEETLRLERGRPTER